MSVLSRHVDAVVVELSWKRTVVIEQGRWHFRSTSWKPHADNVRNLRAIHRAEPDIVGGSSMRRSGASMPRGSAHEVMAEHTYFEYEEFEWHKYRTFSAKGDTPGDVHWPEYTLEPEQRVSERRETYHAKFAVNTKSNTKSNTRTDANSDADEYLTELDEATWRPLKLGKRYRLTVGVLSDEVKQIAPASDGTHR